MQKMYWRTPMPKCNFNKVAWQPPEGCFSLKYDLHNILNWFQLNSLKPKSGKFQLMILRKKINIDLSLYLNGTKIERWHEVVLLWVTIGEELNFKKYIMNLCRVAKYITCYSTNKKVPKHWQKQSYTGVL